MLRTPSVSPLLLLLAQRARHRLIADPQDAWKGMGGLRRESMDPDRTLDNWFDAWPAVTRQSLDHAWAHPLLAPASIDHAQPAALAQALVNQDALPSDGRLIGDAWVLPWAVTEHAYAPALIDRICAVREAGQQAWVAVSASDSEAAARDDRVHDGLRLGLAWLLLPPGPGEEEAFERGLRAWTRTILHNPQHDQWVGLWAELMERIFQDLAQCGQISRRSTAPDGWPRCPQAHWMSWARTVLDTWREVWPGPAQLEDVCLGLLQPREVLLAEA